jgi:hypothetical protein
MEPVNALTPIPSSANHLALIGGLPCSATYFAAELCRDLLSRKHGMCEVVVLNDLGEATLQNVAAAEHPIVFLAEIPDAAVVDAVRDAVFPILLIDQAFSAASEDFIATRDAKLLNTVRTMARAQIGLNALVDIPRSALLAADMHEPASILAQRIAAECGIEPAHCQSAVEERDLDRPLIDALGALFAHDRSTHCDEVSDVLRRLDRFYSCHPERLDRTWSMPISLLLEAVSPYLPATGPINLLGPARCLSFGPYLSLPKGRWKANFAFSASNNRSANTIGFDITADEEIKLEESFEITQSGKFAIESQFSVENPYYPIEFRTYLRRGSIEGEFALTSFTLERCK